jgi:hypothetical protein
MFYNSLEISSQNACFDIEGSCLGQEKEEAMSRSQVYFFNILSQYNQVVKIALCCKKR